MAVTTNGVARRGELMAIPGGRLAKGGPGECATAMHNAARADGVLLFPVGPVSSFRLLSAQHFFWNNQPPPAAFPGTSNHGWGKAVDYKLLARVFAWLGRRARVFGFSNEEGRRVGEDWHWGYVGGEDRALVRRWFNPNPLRPLLDHEEKMARTLIRRRRKMRAEEKSGRGPKFMFWRAATRRSRKKVRRQMTKLYENAKADRRGIRRGWAVNNRGVRRHLLARVYTGRIA